MRSCQAPPFLKDSTPLHPPPPQTHTHPSRKEGGAHYVTYDHWLYILIVCAFCLKVVTKSVYSHSNCKSFLDFFFFFYLVFWWIHKVLLLLLDGDNIIQSFTDLILALLMICTICRYACGVNVPWSTQMSSKFSLFKRIASNHSLFQSQQQTQATYIQEEENLENFN